MAGDWIPMRLDLSEDPAVMQMAEALECREEVIVGYLHKVWSWASRQCHDGSVTNVTLLSLGRVTNLHGFPEAMRDAGWIVESRTDGGVPILEFPKWDNWLGQSAKKRIQDAKRQAKARVSSKKPSDSGSRNSHADVTKMSRSERDKSVTTGEERRVQERRVITNKQTDFANSEYLKDQEFADLFGRFRQSSSDNHHWVVSEMTAEAWLMELANLSLDDAKAALRFSTGAGAKKPITNGDHSRKQAGDVIGKRNRKCVSFEEGLLQ